MGYFSQTKTADKGAPDKGAPAETIAARLTERTPPRKISSDAVSTLGHGMTITGNIVCEGAAQIFGRVIGDIQATQVVVGDTAQIEGNITAQDVTIQGVFKGTIRGDTVRLKGSATVDSEVFSKSLTVEENVKFEGVSRRLEKSVDLAAGAASSQTNGARAASLSDSTPHYRG